MLNEINITKYPPLTQLTFSKLVNGGANIKSVLMTKYRRQKVKNWSEVIDLSIAIELYRIYLNIQENK